MNPNLMVDIKKALGASAVSAVLEQPVVDRLVRDIVDYRNPLRMNLPRKQGSGAAWLLNRRSAGSTPASFIADTGDPTEDTSTYTRVTFTYRTISTRGKVTRLAQRIGMSYTDVLAQEIASKAKDFRNYEDFALIRANSGTANQYDGLEVLLDIFSAGGVGTQVVAQTTAMLGDQLSLEKLDEAIDKCVGDPDMIICSKAGRRKLKALLQADQRFVNTIEVRGGFKLLDYNGIPVYTSNNVTDTKHFDGTGCVGETGTTTNFYIVDTSELFVAELTPVTMEMLDKVSSQYDQFDIYGDQVLVMGATNAHSALIGVKTT